MDSKISSKFSLSERACFISVLIITFAVYLLTLPRTVVLEDDGLFLMSSYFMGISHPPGYPFYSLVSWFFVNFPIGSIPFRVHAMSAFFAAAACSFLYFSSRFLELPKVIAITVALSYGFSKTFWSQAIIAEVYSLNAFFVFSMLSIALYLNRKYCYIYKQELNQQSNEESSVNIKIIFLGAFIYGLSFSVHVPLVILFSPSLAILLFPFRKQIIKNFPLIFVCFSIGLCPYLWMIWRSNTDVVINFYGAIQSFSDLKYVFSRDGYVEVDISETAGLSDKLGYFFHLLDEIYNQFSLVGLLFVITGFIYQWWIWQKRVCWALFILFLFNSFFFLLVIYFDYDFLSRSVFSVYPFIAYAVMAIWLGLGVKFVFVKIKRYQYVALIALLILIVFSTVFKNYSYNSRSSYKWADQYGMNLLKYLPENSDLFVSGDIHTFVLGYKHHVEKVRPDVRIYNLQGLVFANRIFHPVKTTENDKANKLEQFVKKSERPACTSDAINSNQPHTDYWLFSCLSSEVEIKYQVELNSDLLRYFDEIILDNKSLDPWTIHHRQQLIKKFGTTLGKMKVNNIGLDNISIKKYIQSVTNSFFGALGYIEGMNMYSLQAKDINEMIRVIKHVDNIPALAKKHDKASYYKIRGDVSLLAGDSENAIKEYNLSINIWPDRKNSAIEKLEKLYLAENKKGELTKLKLRFSEY